MKRYFKRFVCVPTCHNVLVVEDTFRIIQPLHRLLKTRQYIIDRIVNVPVYTNGWLQSNNRELADGQCQWLRIVGQKLL